MTKAMSTIIVTKAMSTIIVTKAMSTIIIDWLLGCVSVMIFTGLAWCLITSIYRV